MNLCDKGEVGSWKFSFYSNILFVIRIYIYIYLRDKQDDEVNSFLLYWKSCCPLLYWKRWCVCISYFAFLLSLAVKWLKLVIDVSFLVLFWVTDVFSLLRAAVCIFNTCVYKFRKSIVILFFTTIILIT